MKGRELHSSRSFIYVLPLFFAPSPPPSPLFVLDTHQSRGWRSAAHPHIFKSYLYVDAVRNEYEYLNANESELM